MTLGAFRLSPSLVERIGPPTPLPVSSIEVVPQPLRARARLVDGGIYLGADPAAPRVGDLRVRFRQVEPAVVSVAARQTGAILGPYATRAGFAWLFYRPLLAAGVLVVAVAAVFGLLRLLSRARAGAAA